MDAFYHKNKLLFDPIIKENRINIEKVMNTDWRGFKPITGKEAMALISSKQENQYGKVIPGLHFMADRGWIILNTELNNVLPTEVYPLRFADVALRIITSNKATNADKITRENAVFMINMLKGFGELLTIIKHMM